MTDQPQPQTQPGDHRVYNDPVDAKLREIWDKSRGKFRLREILRSCIDPTLVEVMGCRFLVHPRDNLTEFVMWRDLKPPEFEGTSAVIDRLGKGDVSIVDVGANAGAFCLPIMKAVGKGSRAVAFEPNPTMLARLRTNIGLNGFDNIAVIPCAVSDVETTAKMLFPVEGLKYFPNTKNLGMGRIDLEYGDKGTDVGAEVQVRPLQSCLEEANVGRVDFLKVDVEGLEDRVIAPLLEGSENLWPKLLYFEVEHSDNWKYPLRDLLGERGYAQIARFKKNILFERPVD